MVVIIDGKKHWLWRAVDQHRAVFDVPVPSRRDRRLMRKLLKRLRRPPNADHRQI
jgi:putative transposase